MPVLDARLLGPFEVRVDGEPVTVPGRNARKVLVMLLDEANRPVQITGLVRGLWEDAELPDDPRKRVRNLVGEIRKTHRLLKDRLETVNEDAYRFTVAETELDVLRRDAAERRARSLRDSGDLQEAAAQLRSALAEWRGPALAGMSGRMIESIARTLDDDRLPLLEQRFDVELELGRHGQLVGELRQIARVHAGDQRFAFQLMLALHRTGQPSEAVKHFAALRRRLADEFGIDPDPRLVELNAAILRNDPALDPPPTGTAPAAPQPRRAPIPFTLPPAPARFTGRELELRALDAALDAAAGQAGLAVVSGMGGVGKTSLALRWSHRVAERFGDGCFYFDLRGFDPVASETGPGPALGKALRRLGVDQHHLPGDIEEQADLYRTMLAGRRVLVVLDNVRDAQQVRPLLPGSADSFTVVTSRNRLMGLIGLDGALPVPLGVLTREESTAVLRRFVAGDLAESRAARRIVAVCAGLPLALCLVGAWAAANPGLPLSSLADRLESTGNVLRVLSSDDPTFDPRTVFSCSYQELDARERKAFRLLGLHPGPDITAAAMGSLAAVAPREAEETLRALATVQLVHEHQPGRFTMHDLLRAFAVERLEAEVDEAERSQAVRRMLEHYVHTADRADLLLASYRDRIDLGEVAAGVTPEPIGDAGAARRWFEAEYQVLLALVRLKVEPVHDRRIWQLAWCLAECIMARHRAQDLIDCQSAGLAAARRSRDVFAEIISLGYLAGGLLYLADRDAAVVRLDRAMALAEEHGMPWAKGFVLHAMSLCEGRDGRDEEAIEQARRAREHFMEAGDAIWTMRTEHVIGWHSARIGDLAEARTCFGRMLSAGRESGVAVAEATALFGFGYIAHRERRFDEALRCYSEARDLYDAPGMESSVAYVDEHIGDTRHAMGDRAAARAEWERALHSYRALDLTVDTGRVQRKLDGGLEVA
ncbi:AfsR/SARP family transcriptional regulator [Glycomyces arizonensis]|uniref:AfsR/SARP family transcriptional regulator n=1 Tax=Glycomyces arizonensis TaxID=256035 RepID=UPI0004063822|nr:BTAD domain-containing putative transcriptional regulator [Glycomyces arizonensis]